MCIAPVGQVNLAFAHCCTEWRCAIVVKATLQVSALKLKLRVEYLKTLSIALGYVDISEERALRVVVHCHTTACVLTDCIGCIDYCRHAHSLAFNGYAPCVRAIGKSFNSRCSVGNFALFLCSDRNLNKLLLCSHAIGHIVDAHIHVLGIARELECECNHIALIFCL